MRKKLIRTLLAFATPVLAAATSTPVLACDACALYNSSRLSGHLAGSLALSLSEQFTNYRVSAPNPYNVKSTDLTRSYNTSQLNVNYDLSDELGVQATLPYVVRHFDEVKDYRGADKTESGIGDGVLVANYSPLSFKRPEYSVNLSLLGGVKLPTGDSGSLSEQTEEAHDTERNVTAAMVQHHQISGIPGLQGRTLTIGTGSIDYIVGTALNARWERILLLSSVQYSIKTEGSFDYRFANELLWNAGPGVFLLLDDNYTLMLRAALSGEHTDRDTYKGNKVPNSNIANLYLGPEISLTLQNRLTIELGVDSPIDTNGSESAIQPDYRVRSAISYRF